MPTLFYLFIWESVVTEAEGAEEEKEGDSVLSGKPDMDLDLRDSGIKTWVEDRSLRDWTTQAPANIFLKNGNSLVFEVLETPE